MAEIPKITIAVEKILRAFQPGDIVFIECERPMPVEAMQQVSAQLKAKAPEIKIIVLQAGLRVVAREETMKIDQAVLDTP